MDDHSFDKFIKDKLDGYEDSSFDPSALEGFHERLAAFRTVPWYQTNFTYYLAAASLTLFTFINAYLFWPANKEGANKNISLKSKEQQVIDSLTTVIHHLETQSKIVIVPDSASMKNSSASLTNKSNKPGLATSRNKNMIALGPVSDLSPGLYETLLHKGMLVVENEKAYLVSPDRVSSPYGGLTDYSQARIAEVYPSPESSLKNFSAAPESDAYTAKVEKIEKHNTVSSKTRKALEKYYSKGIGINLAPHVDLVQGIFSKGDGLITPRIGVVADWVVSPSLSFETGIDYFKTSVRFRDRDDFQNVTFPNEDPSLGTINNGRIENTLLSTPIALKYRQWISEKSQAFVRVGYTPYFSVLQEYECGYDFNNKGNYYPNGSSGSSPHLVDSYKQYDDRYFYGNTSSISLGLTRQMKEKNKLEASVFYEKSLSAVGNEKSGMQLFGLRTAYWFNLR